jgi:S-(hydroxymethyl)glutathione dehydrogenase / alcohol dehydrogenase
LSSARSRCSSNEKTLVGSYYGSSDVRSQFHDLIRLWRAGRLDLEGMISQRGTLEDINRALDDLARGAVIRTVISP